MAKSIRAIVKPEILAWARTTAGYDVIDAAASAKVKPDQLMAWEQGDGSPTVPQLRKLASVYKRPLAVFYLQEVPKDFMVLRDLRRLPEAEQRSFSPDLLLEIRRAEQRRELALELLTDSGERPAPFEHFADFSEDPEAIGIRIRKILGISAEMQYQWRSDDGRSAFNHWRSHIERLGVLVFQSTRFGNKEACGFAISADVLPVISVNRRDRPHRRTFSLLHELAHILTKISSVSDDFLDDRRPADDARIEVFCNAVAAAALMPKGAFLAHKLISDNAKLTNKWSDDLLKEIAKDFGVSKEAALRRLLTFGLTSQAFYRQKRAEFLEEYRLAAERQVGLKKDMKRNMPQETLSNFGRPLIGMLLDSYYSSRVTLSEVSGYLGIKTRHIPKLEQVVGLRP